MTRVYRYFSPHTSEAVAIIVALICLGGIGVFGMSILIARRQVTLLPPLDLGRESGVQALVWRAMDARDEIHAKLARFPKEVLEALEVPAVEDVRLLVAELETNILNVLSFLGPAEHLTTASPFFEAVATLARSLELIYSRVKNYREKQLDLPRDTRERSGGDPWEKIGKSLQVAIDLAIKLSGKK